MTRQFRSPGSSRDVSRQLLGTDGLAFFSEGVTRLYPPALRLARRLLGNASDAEEVVQESLLKAFQHIREYRGEAAFSTWLLRILWNECMNFHRTRRHEIVGLNDLPSWQESQRQQLWTTSGETPEQICRAMEIKEAVGRALDRLTPRYRQAWVLREIEHLSHAEVAKRLDVPVTTIKIRIHRARVQLRGLLSIRLLRPGQAGDHVSGARSAGASARKSVRIDSYSASCARPLQAA